MDYVRDAGEAEKIKEQYKRFFSSQGDKNSSFSTPAIIASKSSRATELVQTTLEEIPNEKEREFRRKPVAFNGEMTFTSMLLALENPRPFKAYFLQGHGEGALDDSGNFGFLKFATTLAQNYIAVTNLELTANEAVPMDCNLLIIAAPVTALPEDELKEIGDYLTQGGRLFALFNYDSIKQPTGLEPILQQWGINVVADVIKDPGNTMTGQDVKIRRFARHPAVNSLAQFSLQMILPRPIESVNWRNPPANAPQVTELAFSSPDSTLGGDPTAAPRSYPVIAAVEQKPVAGVANPRGNTRIIVAGDSIFLGNYYIEGGANRDFVSYAANWLLDRTDVARRHRPAPGHGIPADDDAKAAAKCPLAAARRAARRNFAARRNRLAGAQKIMNSKNTALAGRRGGAVRLHFHLPTLLSRARERFQRDSSRLAAAIRHRASRSSLPARWKSAPTTRTVVVAHQTDCISRAIRSHRNASVRAAKTHARHAHQRGGT